VHERNSWRSRVATSVHARISLCAGGVAAPLVWRNGSRGEALAGIGFVWYE